ncbi:glycoside hydrolase family 16 protein [Mycena leptocephala]|nr:glycoside hydrolase family 16 protein [Mycena leptocephala]
MSCFNPTVFGVLALAASATASHSSFKRMSNHARVAASEWKRSAVSGVAYYGFQNNTMNACGTYSKDSDMIIGVGPDYYGDMGAVSDKCFQHITVTLKSDWTKSVDVTLTDACQDCGGPGNVYLSTGAFQALTGGSLDAGVLDVTWNFGSSSSGQQSSSSGEEDTSPAETSTADESTSTSDSDEEDCSDEDEASSTADAEPTATPAKVATTTAHAVTSTAKTPAKATSEKASKTTSTTTSKSTGTSNEGWKLTKKLEGQTFLDFFNYDSNTNDNGGVAQYVNGVKEGLAYTSGDQVILAVDTAEDVAARNSLRMVSKTTFNAKDMNLFIFDIAHMPAVCGTWPAVWFTGANWPYDGEIDVVEGVSLYDQNIYSVHTGSGCSISDSAVSSMTKVKIVQTDGTNCDANANPAGCGFTDQQTSTFGPGFNSAGGGVFALQFDTTGIKMWFFQSGSVPGDISSLAPNPSSWGAPRMSVPTSNCSPTTYFNDLMMVVDTNLGGTFTEGVWGVDGAGGQATSCKTKTGVDTAAEYVKSHGSEFGDAAQWKINGFYIYNQ